MLWLPLSINLLHICVHCHITKKTTCLNFHKENHDTEFPSTNSISPMVVNPIHFSLAYKHIQDTIIELVIWLNYIWTNHIYLWERPLRPKRLIFSQKLVWKSYPMLSSGASHLYWLSDNTSNDIGSLCWCKGVSSWCMRGFSSISLCSTIVSSVSTLLIYLGANTYLFPFS